MSAKHRSKSLALNAPAALRAALRARVGRNGSVADAARRVLAAAFDAPLVLADCPAGAGRPVRLQLPHALRARLAAEARARGLAEEALARAILAGALLR